MNTIIWTMWDSNWTHLPGGQGCVRVGCQWCAATPPDWGGCEHTQCGPGGQPRPGGTSPPRPPGPPPSPPAAAPPGPERGRGTPAQTEALKHLLYCWIEFIRAALMSWPCMLLISNEKSTLKKSSTTFISTENIFETLIYIGFLFVMMLQEIKA